MRVGIVGAGINGLWLAWRLAEKGNDVTVFEKKTTIGKAACSGLVSERIWDFIPRRSDMVKNVINKGRVNFPSRTIELDFTPRMLVLDHAELDRYLAELATKAGAKILLGHSFTRLFYHKGKKPQIAVNASQANEPSVPVKHTHVYEFDVLIGSDGPHSLVRKQLGFRDPDLRLGVFCYVSKKSSSNTIEVFPHKNGFSWIIPRGDSLEYGTLEKPDVAKKYFEEFCRSRRIKPKEIMSAMIHMVLPGCPKATLYWPAMR